MVDRDKANERVCGTDAAKGGVAERVIAEDVADVSATRVWRTFASYYRPYRALFVFDLVCATVLAALDLAFPQFLNFFTKDFFLRPSDQIIAALGWIFSCSSSPYMRCARVASTSSPAGGTSLGSRTWKLTCGATCSSSTSV